MANKRAEFLIEPDKLREMREVMGLTQQQAAEIIYSTVRAWQSYEYRITPMPRLKLEIFQRAYEYHQDRHNARIREGR